MVNSFNYGKVPTGVQDVQQLVTPPQFNVDSSSSPMIHRAPNSGQGDQGQRNISRLLRPSDFLSAQMLSAFIYACQNLRGETIAKYPLRALTSRNKEVFGPAAGDNYDHPLFRLMRKPNPVQGRYEFMYTISNHVDALGNSIVLMDGIDGYGVPTALWPLSPARTYPIVTADKSGYGYQDFSGVHWFLPTDRVLHFKSPSPRDVYWGEGKVEILAKEINLHYALTEYVSQFFAQGAQPAGILTTPNELSPDAFERLRIESRLALAGSINAHRLAVLDNGLEYKQLAATLKELGATELEIQLMKKILAVYQIPGTKFGLIEFASYKADDMEKSFVDSMEAHAQIYEDPLSKLAGMYQANGKPVPDDEMLAVRTGQQYPGRPKGLHMGIVLPPREPLMVRVQSANGIAKLPQLTENEKRQASLKLLGDLITQPDTASGDELAAKVLDDKVKLATALATAKQKATPPTLKQPVADSANPPTDTTNPQDSEPSSESDSEAKVESD